MKNILKQTLQIWLLALILNHLLEVNVQRGLPLLDKSLSFRKDLARRPGPRLGLKQLAVDEGELEEAHECQDEELAAFQYVVHLVLVDELVADHFGDNTRFLAHAASANQKGSAHDAKFRQQVVIVFLGRVVIEKVVEVLF